MEAALPIQVVDFDISAVESGDITSMTAEEYLSWVRYQSEQLPIVSRAPVDMSKYEGKQNVFVPEVDTIAECDDEYLPSIEWTRSALNSFSELRSLFSILKCYELGRSVAVPPLRSKDAWIKFCYGEFTEEDATKCLLPNDESIDECDIKRRRLECAKIVGIELEGDLGNDEVEARPSEQDAWGSNVVPTVSLMLQFDQVLTQRVLGYLTDYLQSRCRISPTQGYWLYALLARLEKPLHKETAATLRDLYRTCCNIRRTESTNLSDSSEWNETLAILNTLIIISGAYFGQGEICSNNVFSSMDENTSNNDMDEESLEEEDIDDYAGEDGNLWIEEFVEEEEAAYPSEHHNNNAAGVVANTNEFHNLGKEAEILNPDLEDGEII